MEIYPDFWPFHYKIWSLIMMWNETERIAVNNYITVFSWEHPKCWSCRCFHVKFGPHVTQGSVKHRDFSTKATATHLFKHFVVLSQESLQAPCALEVQSFQPDYTKTQSSGAIFVDYKSVPNTPVIWPNHFHIVFWKQDEQMKCTQPD